jgi:hypothetical protein
MHCANSLPRLLTTLLFFLGALSSAGCVPGVAWLPDSNGFIYTSGEHFTKLVHYDVAKGQEHVLVEDTGAATLWPALSPDGQRIAVARLTVTKGLKTTKLQVILYSRAGKELDRSKVFDWMELEKPAPDDAVEKPTGMLPQLFWAPHGDKIIVHTSGVHTSGAEQGGYTAIYDVKADKLIHAGDAQLLTFGSTPVRPDGAGFLVMKNMHWPNWWVEKAGEVDPDPRFAFVDWQGEEKALKPPAFLLDADALKKERDANKLGGLLWPAYYESGWQGDVAQVSWNKDRLRYLTSKGEAVLEPIKAEKTKDGNLVMRQYQFPGGRTWLRVVVTKWDDQKPGDSGSARLEVLKAGQQEPQVIREEIMPCVLIPAPNGKRVAVWTTVKEKKGKEQSLIVVVDDQGKVTRIPLAP